MIGDFIFEHLHWFVTGFIILILSLIASSAYQEIKCCSRFEHMIVHQEAWTQYISDGKSMTPVYHPAGDYYKKVCVKQKESCQGVFSTGELTK